jgi:hypothetical protein
MLAFVMPGAPNPSISIVLAGGSGSSAIIQMTITGYLMDL